MEISKSENAAQTRQKLARNASRDWLHCTWCSGCELRLVRNGESLRIEVRPKFQRVVRTPSCSIPMDDGPIPSPKEILLDSGRSAVASSVAADIIRARTKINPIIVIPNMGERRSSFMAWRARYSNTNGVLKTMSLNDLHGHGTRCTCPACRKRVKEEIAEELAKPFLEVTTTEEKATRHNSGKPKVSLVLEAREAIEGLAHALEFGVQKYGRKNYMMGDGLPQTEILDSLLRHSAAYMAGEDIDKESNLPHIDLLLSNALMLSQMAKTRPKTDDRVIVSS